MRESSRTRIFRAFYDALASAPILLDDECLKYCSQCRNFIHCYQFGTRVTQIFTVLTTRNVSPGNSHLRIVRAPGEYSLDLWEEGVYKYRSSAGSDAIILVLSNALSQIIYQFP
jgi:hypothetical protein